MEKFKPNYLKCYDYDLTVNILAKYIKEYMDSLSDDIDKLFTMNILMFYYNIFVYEDDCDNYISYNELLESEILDTYDDGHTILTFALCIAHSTEIIPPVSPCFLGFVCFFLTLTPLTTNLFVFGITSITSPVFPLSFPDKTLTVSPFLILNFFTSNSFRF